MNHSFGSSSSVERLGLLKRKHEEFRRNPLDEHLANELCVVAWSLCDWVFKEHKQLVGYRKLVDFQNALKGSCSPFSIIQDIANGSKHRTITTYTPSIIAAKRHDGSFSSAFSRAFDISCLQVILQDGTFVWFEDAIAEVLNLWQKFFDDHRIS